MEALSSMMVEAEARGLVARFSIGPVHNHGLSVLHLLFADDTLIFCDVDEKQLCNLRCLFLCFEVASGLKINLSLNLFLSGRCRILICWLSFLIVGW